MQQQQRAFGKKGFTTRSTQVVKHRQQYECDVTTAAEKALDVNRQLHHRLSERVEPVFAALAGAQRRQVVTGQLHFLDQQRGTVGFGYLQGTANLMQQFPGTR